ncbi:MAG: DNA methyltransferase [Candidatus Paceibacterota bacterium]
MKKLQWRTVQKRVDDLIPQDTNPRIISNKQMEDLKKSIEKMNIVEIPACDLNFRILAGHQRVKALQLLGRGNEIIDVRVPNRQLTKEESKRYLIASNALGGDWDFESLKSFKLDLLTDIGFDQIELSKMWDEHPEIKEDTFDNEKELGKIRKTDIKLGDLFALGRHRLICANSLDPNNVKALMGEVRADLINDDIPFNIGLSYDRGVGSRKHYGGTINDNKSDEDYKIFVKTIIQNALSVTKKDAHVMFFCDERYVWLLQTTYKELGIDSKRILVWLKNNSSPTPTSAFNKVTEFIVYGTIGSPYLSKLFLNFNEIQNDGMTAGNNLSEEIMDQLNIWMVKRLPSNQYSHPTEKSPSLHYKALRRCTRVGDVVLDLTAGSGSILVACEQLKRTAYVAELEPIFCQLIINHYEKLTGKKAKLIKNIYEEK